MNVRLIQGDCLTVMPALDENSVDTVVTDPPYGLSFMGKGWDHGVPGEPFWREALRVAKPGAFLLAFGGTRTFHRLTCAIEDAGWEIRDCMMWLYGSGFPKSLDISKAIDKAAGTEKVVGTKPDRWTGKGGTLNFSSDRPQSSCKVTEPGSDQSRQWSGWGTALKPAWEPIIVAMKPCDGTFAENAEKYGVAGLNIDGGRIAHNGRRSPCKANGTVSRNSNNVLGGGHKDSESWDTSIGRWPANVILDDEAGQLLDQMSAPKMHGAGRARDAAEGTHSGGQGVVGFTVGAPAMRFGDSGGASRFFYCAKASRSERGQDNKHPTVKPLALMEYLCTLTKTPATSNVLDPFMGSGTTGIAALKTGRDFIGIEMEDESFNTASRRIEAAQVARAELLIA